VNISVTVNGARRDSDVDPRTLLVYYLREHLALTGTHVGCDSSSCGCCVVVLDGTTPVKSCTMLAVQADGHDVTTVEGLADGAELHPLQQAFWDQHGLQCGYCTPGMLMTASALLAANPDPTEEEVRVGLSGNLCSCTGYQNIVKAVLQAADAMRQPAAPAQEGRA